MDTRPAAGAAASALSHTRGWMVVYGDRGDRGVDERVACCRVRSSSAAPGSRWRDPTPRVAVMGAVWFFVLKNGRTRGRILRLGVLRCSPCRLVKAPDLRAPAPGPANPSARVLSLCNMVSGGPRALRMARLPSLEKGGGARSARIKCTCSVASSPWTLPAECSVADSGEVCV